MWRGCAVALVAASVLVAGTAMAGEPAVSFAAKPAASQAGSKTTIRFAVSAATDVEVAILDARGMVVRHLAAGVLGGQNPPPPPLKAGLEQSIEWDGKDDYGQPVADAANCSVRVRAGMGVKLDRIVGGDPYAFWSELCDQGDHTQFKVTGLEAKADGKVYVLGHTTSYGHPALRQYDARGNYLRTLFPPPAGRPVEDVEGWGVNIRDDGTYTLRASFDRSSAVPGRPALCGSAGTWCGLLVATPDTSTLCLATPPSVGNGRLMIGADGTLRRAEPSVLLEGESMPKKLTGPLYSAFSPDGKIQYVSGVCGADEKGEPQTTGPWRDGQVWRVDPATRKASVFFALDEKDLAANRGAIGHTRYTPYSALQGVAVDAEGRVFVCDRVNRRVAVLNLDGKVLGALPVDNPDAVAVSPNARAVYVTTRFGHYHARGKLALLRFGDWTRPGEPPTALPLCDGIGAYRESSRLAVARDKDDVLVWVAYTTLPVRVYRDTGAGLELVKDFYQAGPQRALDMRHMMLDQKTGDAYIADNHGFCFRVRDWADPKFELCMTAAGRRLEASSIAIEPRSRHIYTHYHWKNGVYRWAMDGEYFTPAPVGQSGNRVTQQITCSWIFRGLGERGMAAAPGGGLATLGVLPDAEHRADDYSGPLHYFKPDPARAPWQPLLFKSFGGKRPISGGVRFDPRGNLYAGLYDGKTGSVPRGFENDPDFARTTGRIYRYAPTGSGEGGDWFPTEPAGPAKIYDVQYGPLVPADSMTPRFGVDGYGRIYYPTGLLPRVSVIDNEGNLILAFGTYGNRDSMGGLPGDLVPTRDVPLAWANSVDATDDFICVSDILNVRLLRLTKTFAAVETVKVVAGR